MKYIEERKAKEDKLKAKENKALERDASTYVQAHSDLLAELLKRYPQEDFSWLEKLTPSVKAESESEREDNNVTKAQTGGDPPTDL